MATYFMSEESEQGDRGGLIDRAKGGDTEAFNRLVMFHQENLRRFLKRKIPSQEDAADLCQEVLLRAYLKLDRFQGRSTFRTWLISIAKHAVAEYYRLNRGPKIIDEYYETASNISDETSPSNDDSVQELCDIHQQIEHCLACIMRSVSLQDQLAVILCDIYGFSDRETSKIMGKTVGAFKHLLHRARMMMDLMSHDSCALVRKTGGSSECGSQNAFLHQRSGTWAASWKGSSEAHRPELSKNALLSLRAQLVRGIESLTHSDLNFRKTFAPILGKS
jgi:RNA polymerase sigma-70 factor (ECF subfamily)